jgi:putative redox protein
MNNENIRFAGSTGEELAAILNTPGSYDKLKGYCLFAHCFTCNKNLKMVTSITKKLTDFGYGVFRFDFTGLGQSGGEFSETNFTTNTEDFLKAAEYLAENYQPACVTIGHSLGGAAVLNASGRLDSVKAVVTIGAPSQPMHVMHLFEDYLDDLKTDNEEVTLKIAGRDITIKPQFVMDLESHNLDDEIQNLGKPLMIFHSPVDKIVGIDQAKKIYMNAKHPKSFISLDDADHLLSKTVDAEFVASMLATWADHQAG